MTDNTQPQDPMASAVQSIRRRADAWDYLRWKWNDQGVVHREDMLTAIDLAGEDPIQITDRK